MVRRILEVYARGMFPMAEPDGTIYLYDPDPRAIIPLTPDALHISRSLRKRVRSGGFRITTDLAFHEVIRACAAPRPAKPAGTWIDDQIIAIYEALHEAGHAHSIEAWAAPSQPGAPPVLVGGLFGVQLNGLFAGESMFSRPGLGGTDASKVCLVHLWNHLRERGLSILDIQFNSPHLERMGAVEISRDDYKARLAAALIKPAQWTPFSRETPQTPA